ncbi:RloB family protein [Streptomyces sp. NPDC050610]|uniref:RloB family protein n=1 Tax=Streptomyces sp. NPDC050610 TaxID=3157097 RepID=UPI0034143E25
MYVFTEGKVTEPEYIRFVWKQGVPKDPALTVEVHIANAKDDGSRRMPLDLVGRAILLQQEKQRDDRKAKLPPPLHTQVWCLFDHDNHPGVDTALARAESHELPVAFSHPCFELWRVLHLKAASGSFGGVCGMAERRLPAGWHKAPGGIKAVLPEQVRHQYEDAKGRALKMNAEHPDRVPRHKRDPYTDVYEFVEKGLGVASY